MAPGEHARVKSDELPQVFHDNWMQGHSLVPFALVALRSGNGGRSVKVSLFHMQEQIVAARKGAGKRAEKVDWKELYIAAKKFL